MFSKILKEKTHKILNILALIGIICIVLLGLFAFEKMKEAHTFGSNCLPSVSADNIDIFNKKLEGLKIIFPVTKIGNNLVAEFEDSEGNHIELTIPIG